MEFEIYFFNKNELCTNYLVRQPHFYVDGDYRTENFIKFILLHYIKMCRYT